MRTKAVQRTVHLSVDGVIVSRKVHLMAKFLLRASLWISNHARPVITRHIAVAREDPIKV